MAAPRPTARSPNDGRADPSLRRVDRRIGGRWAGIRGAGSANVWLRPWPVDVEAQMGGALRLLAGGAGLHGVDPQTPALRRKVDRAFRVRGDALGDKFAVDDVGDAFAQREFERQPIESGS